jgi:hypothetical protein
MTQKAQECVTTIILCVTKIHFYVTRMLLLYIVWVKVHHYSPCIVIQRAQANANHAF